MVTFCFVSAVDTLVSRTQILPSLLLHRRMKTPTDTVFGASYQCKHPEWSHFAWGLHPSFSDDINPRFTDCIHATTNEAEQFPDRPQLSVRTDQSIWMPRCQGVISYISWIQKILCQETSLIVCTNSQDVSPFWVARFDYWPTNRYSRMRECWCIDVVVLANPCVTSLAFSLLHRV